MHARRQSGVRVLVHFLGSISGDFIYYHDEDPQTDFYKPAEKICPIPL